MEVGHVSFKLILYSFSTSLDGTIIVVRSSPGIFQTILKTFGNVNTLLMCCPRFGKP